MNIEEIRKLSFESGNELYPWIDPEQVTGIDYDASKALYKEIWYGERSQVESQRQSYFLDEDKGDPECDAKRLFDYVDADVSWWVYFIASRQDMPEELSSITTIKVIKASIFFIRCLGYPTAGGVLSSMVKPYSNSDMNKQIFDSYKTAFEEETEPHLKWCLQDNFLDFFGYLPAFDDVHSTTNWSGLHESDLAYLKHLHLNRISEPGRPIQTSNK